MNGRGCRNKGMRAEYVLRDYLRDLSYNAYRVPLSGASEGYKYDVVATKDNVIYTFEIKSRKSSFKNLYLLYNSLGNNGVFRVSLDAGLIALGTSFTEVMKTGGSACFYHYDSISYKPFCRSFGRLWRMDKEWRQGADFLVLKDNGKPMLFIKYWPKL